MPPCSILSRLRCCVSLSSLVYYVGRGSPPSLRCFSIDTTKELPNAQVHGDNTGSASKNGQRFAADSCIPSVPLNLPAPTNCCMSGCHNCVWIAYADELLEHYKDGGEAALRAVDQHIDDENIKMFIKMEIKFRMKTDKT